MNKIICPKCGEKFELTDKDYLYIVDQIKDGEIDKAVRDKEKQLNLEKETEILRLKADMREAYNREMTKKDAVITDLNNKITASQSNKQVEIIQAVTQKEAEISAPSKSIVFSEIFPRDIPSACRPPSRFRRSPAHEPRLPPAARNPDMSPSA